MNTEITDIINSDYAAQAIARIQAMTAPAEPRWRYFNVGRRMTQEPARGYPMYAWSTELADDGSGRLVYASWRWQPRNTGFAAGWVVRALRTHSKRKAAKARALKMRDAFAAKHERV